MFDTVGYKRITIEEINDDGVINLLETFVEKVSKEYMCALDVTFSTKEARFQSEITIGQGNTFSQMTLPFSPIWMGLEY